MKKHMTQEAAIKSAWMILEGLGFSREINGDLDKTVTAVYESAPAADVVEVRHGRWVDEKYVWQGQKSAKCNQCKKKTGYYIQPKYCPSCGAKMDGGKDDA